LDKLQKLGCTLAATINKLNGIFKIPDKFKVTGLEGKLNSIPDYDDTNTNEVRDEVARTVKKKVY